MIKYLPFRISKRTFGDIANRLAEHTNVQQQFGYTFTHSFNEII